MMRRRFRKAPRKAVWTRMEAELSAYVADKRAPKPVPPSPEALRRAEWEAQQVNGHDRLPSWWWDRVERERRYQAERGAFTPSPTVPASSQELPRS